MRWWDELRNPALKCERLGHVMRDREVEVFYWPGRGIMSCVATEAVEITPTCVCCGHTEDMRVEIERHLTGLTMPSQQWRQLRREGRLAR
jgi:hypothetical protein